MNLLSVVIPVKNGEATLAKCLDAINRQTISEQIELIILDSASTDNSRNIALSFGAKIIDIPEDSFNHGLTRNKGVKEAKGDLIYLTVQDASLVENDQLERMATHFDDKDIQSVTGIQGVSNDLDKNPAIWFKRFTKPVPEVRQFASGAFKNLSAQEQLENCNWDDVNSMYRKKALQELPFQKTAFAEDALWARDALMRGWKIVRDSSFIVYHYHHQTFRYVFKMRFTLNYTMWNYFKVMPSIPFNFKMLIQNTFTIIKRVQIPFFKKIMWISHNVMKLAANSISVIVFRLSYFIGKQKSLDKAYAFFCSSVPQGMQNKK